MDKILEFIGEEKWENIKVIGVDGDMEINTLLSSYEDLTDLYNCMEMHPVDELYLEVKDQRLDLIKAFYN